MKLISLIEDILFSIILIFDITCYQRNSLLTVFAAPALQNKDKGNYFSDMCFRISIKLNQFCHFSIQLLLELLSNYLFTPGLGSSDTSPFLYMFPYVTKIGIEVRCDPSHPLSFIAMKHIMNQTWKQSSRTSIYWVLIL